MFLSDCKDVVVSCVIIELTYNHEREGRGNFVQEGKSGELASPPCLSHSADSGVGGRLSCSPAAAAVKAAQTRTFIVQSIAAASQSLSLSRFSKCYSQFSLLTSLQCMQRCIGSMSQTIAVTIFCSQTITGWQVFFPSLSLALALSRFLSLFLSLWIGKWSHFLTPKALKLLLMKEGNKKLFVCLIYRVWNRIVSILQQICSFATVLTLKRQRALMQEWL